MNYVNCIQLTLLILVAYQWKLALSQQPSNGNNGAVEVAKCTQFKKTIFEEVKTFSFLIHGAQEVKYVVDNCKSYAPFIVGGSPASPKEFPHTARVGNAEKEKSTIWFCGGTLISEKYVMTAAHCFFTVNGEANIVRLGELDFGRDDDDAKPEDFGVKRTIEHPDYVNSALYNDIGLMELDRSVAFDSYKHPACLPVNSGDEFSKFLAVGWGSTRFAGDNSTRLLKVALDRFTYDRCQPFAEDAGNIKLFSGLNDNSQLCAGSDKAKDTCHGDSGGPLLAFHNTYGCMYFVVGVTSSGIGGCGTPEVPGIYTRVFKYVGWIRGIVWP